MSTLACQHFKKTKLLRNKVLIIIKTFSQKLNFQKYIRLLFLELIGK